MREGKRSASRRQSHLLGSGAFVRGSSAIGVAAALAFVVAMASPAAALAQDATTRAKAQPVTPLPPPRPLDLDAATPMSAAPSPAGSPAASPDRAKADPVAAEPGGPHPLPAASRERMHACGLEWQKMKMAGQAVDKTWRDFAEVCLTQ